LREGVHQKGGLYFYYQEPLPHFSISIGDKTIERTT